MEEFLFKLLNKCLEPMNEKIERLEQTMASLSYGKPIMSVKEVAEYLGMSKGWVDQNMDDIPCFRLGNRPMFNKEDIDKWRLNKSSIFNERSKSNVKIRIAK